MDLDFSSGFGKHWHWQLHALIALKHTTPVPCIAVEGHWVFRIGCQWYALQFSFDSC
jgi:hypothetical protein